MGKTTTILWTWRQLPDGTWVIGATFNPWWGCIKIAPECKNCYAEDIAKHYGHDVWGPSANTHRRLMSDRYWKQPLQWNRKAEKSGHRQSVFCASMADVFEYHPDILQERLHLWELIGQTPWLNWLLLTKRPENILKLVPALWRKEGCPDNVWVGTSAGTQAQADENVPELLKVKAAVHFVSCEPQLEYVSFRPWLPYLQWMICGGESGSHHRPFHCDWALDLRDQCAEYGVPFFFKQYGGLHHDSGGRILAGQTYDELPPEVPRNDYTTHHESSQNAATNVAVAKHSDPADLWTA